MRKIAVFTATRAEYGLLRPILVRLNKSERCLLQLIVAGSHLSSAHGHTIDEILADGFEPAACIPFNVNGSSPTVITAGIGEMVKHLGSTFADLNPDLVVLLGDRSECLGAALAASLFSIPLAHISGGDITEGAIDDNFRHAISKLSHLHFTSCEAYRNRVIQLGEQPVNVFSLGDLGVENALKVQTISEGEIKKFMGIACGRPYILCTMHPETLAKGQALVALKNMLDSLDALTDRYDIVFTGANADVHGNEMNEILRQKAEADDHYHFFMSLGLVRYLSAARFAACVAGNSSSGILEVPCMGVPVVDIGSRQKGRLRSEMVIHCEPEANELRRAFSLALDRDFRLKAQTYPNPYQGENSSEKIVEVLVAHPLATLVPKKFFNLNLIEK